MPETKAAVLSNDWLSLEETKRALGVSQRTIQKLAQRKQLRFQLQPRPGRGPERVYHRGDVERLENERPPVEREAPARRAVAVRPKAEAAGRETAFEIEKARLAFEEKRLAWQQAERQAKRERARLASLLWLTLEEAATYSGLARATIRRAIEEQKLTAVRAGAWRVRRASLEAFAG